MSHQNEMVLLESKPNYYFLGMLQFLGYGFLKSEKE